MNSYSALPIFNFIGDGIFLHHAAQSSFALIGTQSSWLKVEWMSQ